MSASVANCKRKVVHGSLSVSKCVNGCVIALDLNQKLEPGFGFVSAV